MNKTKLALSFLIVLISYSCVIHEEFIELQNEAKLGQEYFDSIGDSEIPFTDLKRVKSSIVNDSLLIEIELTSIPDILKFNHKSLDLKYRNYSWSVLIDKDGSNSKSENDIEIYIAKWKSIDEEVQSEILSYTQEDIWLINASGGANRLVPIKQYVKKRNTTFRIQIPLSISNELSNLNSSMRVFYKTYFNDGKNKYQDNYPNQLLLTD